VKLFSLYAHVHDNSSDTYTAETVKK
jgi:hypothetical protein